MGTHVSSPSKVAASGDLLSDHLRQNQDGIGARIINRFSVSDGVLPFLFKVLSVGKALSIQTHPDKATAEKLHSEQPHVYKGGYKRTALVSLVNIACRWKPQAGDGDRSDTVFSSLWIPSCRPHRIIFGGSSRVCEVDPGHGPANVHHFCLLSYCLLPGDKEGAEGIVYIAHDCREKPIRSSVGNDG